MLINRRTVCPFGLIKINLTKEENLNGKDENILPFLYQEICDQQGFRGVISKNQEENHTKQDISRRKYEGVILNMEFCRILKDDWVKPRLISIFFGLG